MGRVFQEVGYQCCRFHFARNLLALVPRSQKDISAAGFRTIFTQPNPDAVSQTCDAVRDQLAAGFPKIGPLMNQAKTDMLRLHRVPTCASGEGVVNDSLERVDKEIKRRACGVRILSNEPAVTRLVGAVLADMHAGWQGSDRRYLSEGSMARLSPTSVLVPSLQSWLATATQSHLESPPLSGA